MAEFAEKQNKIRPLSLKRPYFVVEIEKLFSGEKDEIIELILSYCFFFDTLDTSRKIQYGDQGLRRM